MKIGRFRKGTRDRESDKLRLDRVRHAALESLASAERELQGLQRRMDAAREAAALWLDANQAETNAAPLDKAEGTIVGGEKRVVDLRSHIDVFRRIIADIEGEIARD